jgi:adenosylcobinamide-GDP ribazoletransferase
MSEDADRNLDHPTAAPAEPSEAEPVPEALAPSEPEAALAPSEPEAALAPSEPEAALAPSEPEAALTLSEAYDETPVQEELPFAAASPGVAANEDAVEEPPSQTPASDEDSPATIGGLGLAISFLTRLPFGGVGVASPGALARSMGVFPLVGVVVGGIGGAIYAIAHFFMPASAASLLAIGAVALVTGALHEDGLADTADGFGGGEDRADKLAIMRDSRIGTFGMVALSLSLGLRAVALAEIGGSLAVVGALVAAHALSRAAIPLAMQALTPARRDGLGALAGQPSAAQTGIAITLALVVAALVLPPGAALAALAGATAGVTLIVLLAQEQIGGFTGDVLGAVEQAAETLALLGVLAAL